MATRAGPIAGALLQPSPIDVRANLLLGKADELRRELAEHGIEAVRSTACRPACASAARPNLEKLDLFERGWFEIQDAGSQRIVDFCDAQAWPAGGGFLRGRRRQDPCNCGAHAQCGESAGLRYRRGTPVATDAEGAPRRRGHRQPMRIDGVADPRLGRYRRRADVVLVDAPCSGTGTLAPQPGHEVAAVAAAPVAACGASSRRFLPLRRRWSSRAERWCMRPAACCAKRTRQQVDGFPATRLRVWWTIEAGCRTRARPADSLSQSGY